jgi:hypothetical protein
MFKDIIREDPFAGFGYAYMISKWERYYRENYSLKTDFSKVRIPQAGDVQFPWLICRPENFSAEKALRGGRNLYTKWDWIGNRPLDGLLDMSFGRDGEDKPYIVLARANWEADEDLANLSANMVVERKIYTMCLTERWLLGDFLFWEFGEHLDEKRITICSGSRYLNGCVPRMFTLDGAVQEVSIGHSDPNQAHGCWSSRFVIV